MSSADAQPVQGMSDLVVPEVLTWQAIEERGRHVLSLYGFTEIRTPIVERTEVFVRSIGDTTDVVQKEMYTFEDRGGRSLSLRPEGTAGVIRHLSGRGAEAADARLFYVGPMFRSERPQAGRRRQFHQLGVESMGPPNPAADAEVIALQVQLLAEWGLRGAAIQVNTRGLPEDRAAVIAGLQAAVQPHLSRLCDDCRRRFSENILRVLDCKQEACQAIVQQLPAMTSFMSEPSRAYLDQVVALLTRLEIPVEINPRLVRGLDYYVHTVWEVTHSGLGAQDALSGGGRYRMNMADASFEGVGFAMGLERVIAAIEHSGGARIHTPPANLVWLVSQSDAAFQENLVLLQTLRLRGIRARMDFSGRSLKAQMRAANRASARFVIIRGDQEMEKGTFQYKDMEAGTQQEVEMPELLQRLAPVHPFPLR